MQKKYTGVIRQKIWFEAEIYHRIYGYKIKVDMWGICSLSGNNYY